MFSLYYHFKNDIFKKTCLYNTWTLHMRWDSHHHCKLRFTINIFWAEPTGRNSTHIFHIVCVCVFVCVCMFVYLFVYVCVCLCVCVYVFVCTIMCAWMLVCVCLFVCVFACVFAFERKSLLSSSRLRSFSWQSITPLYNALIYFSLASQWNTFIF